MTELWEALSQVLGGASSLLMILLSWLGNWWIVIAWASWWLWGVDWVKVWRVLGLGAWVLLLLGMASAAMVWSQLAPSNHDFLGASLPNFWWQLATISLLAGLTLLCGWLQGVLHWQPAEVMIEPPASAHHDGSSGHH